MNADRKPHNADVEYFGIGTPQEYCMAICRACYWLGPPYTYKREPYGPVKATEDAKEHNTVSNRRRNARRHAKAYPLRNA